MKKDDREKASRHLRSALQLARALIAHPDAFPDDFIALPLDPEIISKVLSPERIRLLNELRTRRSYASVSKLAEALGRSQSRVSRDLAELSAAGLIRLERRGKAKRVIAYRKPILIA